MCFVSHQSKQRRIKSHRSKHDNAETLHNMHSNLIPSAVHLTEPQQKRKADVVDKENVDPSLPSGHQLCANGRQKVSHETEVWSPPPKAGRQSRAVSTSTQSTQSTQTLQSQFQIAEQITHADMQQLQLDTNSSDRQMRIIANFIRRKTQVNRIIEPNYEPHLIDLHTLFTDIYHTIQYQPPDVDAASVPLVLCMDISALLRRLTDYHRREVRIVHHGCDSGKGFLKFNQTLEFETPPLEDAVSDQGRRRVIITAITPYTPESSHIFHFVYNKLQLPVDEVFHTFHSDCKAIAYATGTDGGNSSYPCFYCEVKITVDSPRSMQLEAAKSRTCNSNRRHFKNKLKSKKAAKHHRSCSSDPLRIFPQSSDIIEYVRFPELHLYLHSNWYIRAMEDRHASTKLWYTHFNQTRNPFHGGDFTGPQLHRLLKDDSMAFLKELLQSTEASNDVFLFFAALTAFITLQQHCFGR